MSEFPIGVVAGLSDVSLMPCSDAEIVELWREVEQARRQLDVFEHRVIEQVQARSIAWEHGCKNVVDFGRDLLNLAPGEVRARVRAAEALGPRRSQCGEALEPIYPTVAAALADGSISSGHARVIVATIQKLPHEVAAVMDRTVEEILTDVAIRYDPVQLALHAHDVAAAVDQDGQYDELEHRDRTRELDLTRRPDGSGRLRGDLTPEAAEYVATVLDCLAKPQPAADGTADPRTGPQRRHDALLDACRRLLGSDTLPDSGGCATTVVLTMDLDAYATGTGAASTGHGYPIPADVAKTWLDPETRAILVLLSKTKGIEAYSSVGRLFTEQQRLAMAARDRGCSYWGCDTPAAWCQGHHVTDYQQTRRTRVDDGALVCGANHRSFEAMGWTNQMLNGRPHWVPPTWVDATRTPRRNQLHDRPNPALSHPTPPDTGLPPIGPERPAQQPSRMLITNMSSTSCAHDG